MAGKLIITYTIKLAEQKWPIRLNDLCC